MGLMVPYSPEYKASGTNRNLLSELARLTGGGELPEPVAAFVHNLPAADLASEIWETLLLVVALGAQGCVGFRPVYGSGRVVEEELKVSDFTGVKLATFGDLYIETGDEETLRIKAEDNLIRYFESGVTGDSLEIGQQVGVTLHPRRPVRFYLTVKKLDTIALSGSGNIKTPDLAAERISVKSEHILRCPVVASHALGIARVRVQISPHQP